MRKEEYLAEITAGIKNKQVKQEICAELGEHIDELTEFYLERSYNETEAEEKAVSEMGDGEKIGYELSQLHKHKLSILERLFVWFTCFFSVYMLSVAINSSIYDNLDWAGGSLYFKQQLAEALFLSTHLFASVYFKRRKRPDICSLLIVSYMAGMLVYRILISIYARCSPTLFYLIYIILGRFESIKAILVLNICEVPLWMKLLSLVFYAIILYFIIRNRLCLYELSKKKNTNRFNSISKRVTRTCIVTAVFIIIITAVIYSMSFEYRKERIPADEDDVSIIFAQSDTPCALSELSYNDMIVYSFNSRDLLVSVEPYFDSSPFQPFNGKAYKGSINYIGLKEVSYDDFVKYDANLLNFDFYPDKDYVYFIYKEGKNLKYQFFKDNYDESVWKVSDQDYIFKTDDKEIAPNSYFTVTVHQKGEIKQIP